MISEGKVIKTSGDKATVVFKRQSACGGNCSSCAGCSAPEITAEAENKAGAREGDTVIVESETPKVLKTAFLIYVCPLIAFLTVYFLACGYIGEDKAAFLSAFVFIVFWFVLKRVSGKKNITVRIIKVKTDTENRYE